MAKKKASAKKVQTPKKSTQTAKKVVKKVAKKVITKTSAKKASPKKAVAKKTATKPVKKAVSKAKVVKKSASKITPKKVVSKKAGTSKTKVSVKAKGKASAKAVKAPAKAAKVVKTVKAAPKAAAKTTTAKKPVTFPSAQIKPVASAPKIDLKKMMGKVQPLDDRVLVAIQENEKMTAGGLYIPATVSDVSGNIKGTVVATGRGHQNKKGQIRTMDVQVGDQVIFSEYAGTKVQVENSELVMLRETEILGIVAK